MRSKTRKEAANFRSLAGSGTWAGVSGAMAESERHALGEDGRGHEVVGVYSGRSAGAETAAEEARVAH